MLHLTGYTFCEPALLEVALSLLASARARGLAVTVDPGSAAFLARMAPGAFLAWTEGAAVCFPNRDEAAVLVGDADPVTMAARLTRHYGIVALKLGAAGCVLAVPGESPVRIPAHPAVARDTTGAGDAFCGAFMSRWLAAGPPPAPTRRPPTCPPPPASPPRSPPPSSPASAPAPSSPPLIGLRVPAPAYRGRRATSSERSATRTWCRCCAEHLPVQTLPSGWWPVAGESRVSPRPSQVKPWFHPLRSRPRSFPSALRPSALRPSAPPPATSAARPVRANSGFPS